MTAIKNFIAQKTVGFYIFAVSALFGLLTLTVYLARGGDVLTKLEPAAIVVMSVGVVLNVLLLIKDVKPLEIIPFMLYLVGFAVFMASELNFIGNVVIGIDGNVLDGGFFCVTIFGLISVSLGMAACIVKIDKK